jgi:hypothetical protein
VASPDPWHLLTRGRAAKLQLREDKTHGVFIEGAQSVPATTDTECLNVLARATKNLKFAATKMNRHSSRSHAVCRLFVDVQHSGAEVSGGEGSPAGGAVAFHPDGLDARLDAQERDTAVPNIYRGSSGIGGGQLSHSAGMTMSGNDDIVKWRRGSKMSIQRKLERQTHGAKRTSAVLTLCDLAGSEDVRRPAAMQPRSAKPGGRERGLLMESRVRRVLGACLAGGPLGCCGLGALGGTEGPCAHTRGVHATILRVAHHDASPTPPTPTPTQLHASPTYPGAMAMAMGRATDQHVVARAWQRDPSADGEEGRLIARALP